jgi:hypothetical protein
MFVAKFVIEKREPKELYFGVSSKDSKQLQFSVAKRKPIKFKISDNFKMSAE